MSPVRAFKRPLFFALIFAEFALAMGLAGCMQSRNFTAYSLPVELAARPLQSAQAIDLSRFSGPPADNNEISEGDILGISLATGLNADEIVKFDVRVGGGGETWLPEIGRLPLGGLDVMGAEKMIAAACVHGGLYQHPLVTVNLKEQRKNHITVVGAVKNPGVHKLPRGSSNLMAAILAAGGVEKNAGTKIEIRRPGSPSILASDTSGSDECNIRQVGHAEPLAQREVELVCLNLADAGDKSSGDMALCDGSVVSVERLRPDPIQVIGLVRKPGQYNYPVAHEMRLLSAIAQAGGVSAKQTDKVIVIRRLPDGAGFAGIKASLKKAKRNPAENLRLAPGDVVSVEQTIGTMLADTINFVRFGIGASVPLF